MVGIVSKICCIVNPYFYSFELKYLEKRNKCSRPPAFGPYITKNCVCSRLYLAATFKLFEPRFKCHISIMSGAVQLLSEEQRNSKRVVQNCNNQPKGDRRGFESRRGHGRGRQGGRTGRLAAATAIAELKAVVGASADVAGNCSTGDLPTISDSIDIG